MKAWQKQLDAKSKNIRFLGDATGAFTKAWDVGFDATALLGNERSKRYAIQTEDGKVTSVAVEPDNTGISGRARQTYFRTNANYGQSLLLTRLRQPKPATSVYTDSLNWREIIEPLHLSYDRDDHISDDFGSMSTRRKVPNSE